MKRAKLILLNNPVIVTDEEIKYGDKIYETDQQNINVADEFYVQNEADLKIISTNKQIDYNGIDFGVVDVEKLAMDKLKNKWSNLYISGYPTKPYPLGFKQDLELIMEGFKASQQLNEKKFTREDMIRMAIYIWNKASRPEWGATYNVNEIAEKEIEKLSLPKIFEIEIEESETTIKILKKL